MGINTISSYLWFLIRSKSFLAGARPTQAFWNIARFPIYISHIYIYIWETIYIVALAWQNPWATWEKESFFCDSVIQLTSQRFNSACKIFPFGSNCCQNSTAFSLMYSQVELTSYHTGLMKGKRRKRGKGTASLSGKLGLKELQHLRSWSIPFSGEGRREKMSLTHNVASAAVESCLHD